MFHARFVKLSAAVIAFMAITLVAFSSNTSSLLAQGATPAATDAMMAASGPFPPCPAVMDAMMATKDAMMAGTMGAMVATKDAMMAGTMGAMMATKDAMMAGTMAGTMDAMTSMMVNGCHYHATLAGTNESPAGDPKGQGTVELSFSAPATGPGEVCYEFKVDGLKLPAAAAHIHKGAKGVSGPVVVAFPTAPDAKGVATNCAQKVDPKLMVDIMTHPADYYVNVHNADFPNGAIRGQLELSPMMAK